MELSIIMGRGKDVDGGVWYHGFVVPTPTNGEPDSRGAVWSTPDCRNEQMAHDACVSYIRGQGRQNPASVLRQYA